MKRRRDSLDTLHGTHWSWSWITQVLIYVSFSQVPSEFMPTRLYLTSRSHDYLRASRFYFGSHWLSCAQQGVSLCSTSFVCLFPLGILQSSKHPFTRNPGSWWCQKSISLNGCLTIEDWWNGSCEELIGLLGTQGRWGVELVKEARLLSTKTAPLVVWNDLLLIMMIN